VWEREKNSQCVEAHPGPIIGLDTDCRSPIGDRNFRCTWGRLWGKSNPFTLGRCFPSVGQPNPVLMWPRGRGSSHRQATRSAKWVSGSLPYDLSRSPETHVVADPCRLPAVDQPTWAAPVRRSNRGWRTLQTSPHTQSDRRPTTKTSSFNLSDCSHEGRLDGRIRAHRNYPCTFGLASEQPKVA